MTDERAPHAPQLPGARQWDPWLSALAGWLDGPDLADAQLEHIDKLLRRGLITEAEANELEAAFGLTHARE